MAANWNPAPARIKQLKALTDKVYFATVSVHPGIPEVSDKFLQRSDTMSTVRLKSP